MTGILARADASGALDATFGQAGFTTWTASPGLMSRFTGVAVTSEKKVIVGGDDGKRMFVARYFP